MLCIAHAAWTAAIGQLLDAVEHVLATMPDFLRHVHLACRFLVAGGQETCVEIRRLW